MSKSGSGHHFASTRPGKAEEAERTLTTALSRSLRGVSGARGSPGAGGSPRQEGQGQRAAGSSLSLGHHLGYAGSPLCRDSISEAAGRYFELQRFSTPTSSTDCPTAQQHLQPRTAQSSTYQNASNVASTKFNSLLRRKNQTGGTTRYLIGGF